MRQSDFVSLHCPLNEHTRNLIGADELSLMKPTAYLLNTARGGIIEEDALYEALASRAIAGAALDCFVGEPLTAPPCAQSLISSSRHNVATPISIAWTNCYAIRERALRACQT